MYFNVFIFLSLTCQDVWRSLNWRLWVFLKSSTSHFRNEALGKRGSGQTHNHRSSVWFPREIMDRLDGVGEREDGTEDAARLEWQKEGVSSNS